MPKSKCIAYDISGKRCNKAASETGVWPQNVLCGEHFEILELKNTRYGFKTQYKGGDENEVSLCKDKSRPTQAGKYYLCSEGDDDKGNEYDVCYNEYNKASMGSSARTPGTPYRSPTMRSPTGLTPRSPTAGSRFGSVSVDISKVCPNGEPTKITQSKANQKILRPVKADEFNFEVDVDVEGQDEMSKKPCEQDGLAGLMSRTYNAKRPTRAYAPQLNCKDPILFKQENSANIINLLQDIDRTRNVNDALRKIKMVMELISMQQERAVGVDIDTYNYSVTEDVVNRTSVEFGKRMFNNERIELVLTFLYDYESRDMFNPMKFYGFSIEEPKTGPYIPLLDSTPYAILYAGQRTGFGNIQADIARPRAPSEFFSDKIERIFKGYKAPAVAGAGQQPGGGPTGGGPPVAPGTVRNINEGDCYNQDQIINFIKQLANLEGKIVFPSKDKKSKEMYRGFDKNIIKGNFTGLYVKDLLTSLASKTDTSYGINEFVAEVKAWVANAGDDDGPNRCKSASVPPASPANRSTAGLASAITFTKPVNIYTILKEVGDKNNTYKYKGVYINTKSDTIKEFKNYILKEYSKLPAKPDIPNTDTDPLFTADAAGNFANAITGIFNTQKDNNITNESLVNDAVKLLVYSPKPSKAPATPP